MTTIDNLMALHDEAAGWKAKHYWQDDRGTSESVIADYEKRMKQSREALRTALTEALAAPPVREPLSDKQISKLWSDAHNDTTDRMAFQVLAKAIERAHGTGGDK